MVSMASTLMIDMSKYMHFIDILMQHVDSIDVSTQYVDILEFFRHEPSICRFDRHVSDMCRENAEFRRMNEIPGPRDRPAAEA